LTAKHGIFLIIVHS